MATLAHTDLAAWLLAKEADDEASQAGVAAAADRVCQKLSRPLSRLVSGGGTQAILSRALHIARAEFSFLEGVRAGAGSATCFEGLDERVHQVEVREGLLAVLGILLDLLVGFIGEDLTLRLVLEVWPDLPVREQSRFANSEGQELAS